MGMRDTTWAAVLIALAMTGVGEQAARADTRDFNASGGGLAVAQACARHVAITVDPSLTGRIAVTADANHAEEIGQIAVSTTDGMARVGLRPGLRDCWRPEPHGDFMRTLVLRIRVPAGFPVAVQEAGLGDYRLGAVGRLTVSASGMITLVADSVDGDTRLDLSGAGSLDITRLDANRLAAALSGATSLHVKDGRIGALTLSNSGTATVRIDPVVDSAELDSSGIGTIALGGVRGALHRDVSGLTRITVAGRPLPDADHGDD